MDIKKIKCPKELADLRGWLCWRYEKNGDKKPLKVPYYVSGSRRRGDNGSPLDRKHLTTFSIAKQKAIEGNYEGIGLALMPEFNITVLDFDNCDVTDPAILSIFGETYAELSPSGKGLHAFLRGSLPDRKSGTTKDSFGFEVFSAKGFVTFTGNLVSGAEKKVSEIPTKLLTFYEQRFGAKANHKHITISDENARPVGVPEDFIRQAISLLPNDLPYDEWLQIGMAIHHETQGEGFDLWDEWSAQSNKYSTREYGLGRWHSFGKNSAHPITLRTLIKTANEYATSDQLLQIPVDSLVKFDKIETPKDVPSSGGYYHIISDLEYSQQVKPINWLIKGFLPKATLGVLYGESGSGKSFLALDLCGSLARGLDWHVLRRSKSAPTPRILYVAAEGSGGIAYRLAAYRHQSGIGANAIGFDLIHGLTPNLTNVNDVNRLIEDIEARGLYDLIVIDTFAQSIVGANENSGEDMGRALSLCKKISIVSDAMVLLVHHSGKDASKGARGWSGIFAAADVVFEVKRSDVSRTVTVKKQKDGRDGDQYDFDLLPVVVGQDEDGEDITSCVVGEFGMHQEPVVDKAEEDLI